MMSGIRAKNTKPELLIRSGLHRAGFRFRIHGDLPGKPDLVFPKYRAVIFVHGCFWHGHSCHLFRMPSTRTSFWENKISGNRKRDQQIELLLAGCGWRVLNVWECAVKGRTRLDYEKMITAIARWLSGKKQTGEIGGHDDQQE